MASVRLTGDVVYVSMDEPTINMIILTRLNMHSCSPVSVMLKAPHDHKVSSPSIMNRFSKAVTTIIGIMGFRLFHISFMGMVVINHTTNANTVPIANPVKVSVANSIAM
jgi:hypothetical protein